MIGLYPRPAVTESDGGEDVDDGGGSGYNPFYGIAVVCVSIFLFCVLAAAVRVWEALAFAALAALLLAVAGCFAPGSWSRRSGRPAGAAELVAAGGVRPWPRAPGRAFAPAASAPPAFAFECPLDGGGGEPTACAMVCAVCLEDVRGGEMVRRVPACRHVFHVECIDMWMHAHRTCPVCRCEISPAPRAAGKAAAEEAPESSAPEVLPPV
ncbi:hypothetical protein ACP4OV_009188 [Aristida adscensionis]